jgi:hypothetical protein
MKHRCTTILAMLLAFTGWTRGQQPTSRSSAEIESLIQQLSSDEFKQRESAQQRLVQLGEAVQERLTRVVNETQDEEARARAEAALVQIADNAAVGPTYVNLHFDNAPPQVVFAELARQCGKPLEPNRPDLFTRRPLANISVSYDHKPFWDAMLELSAKTGIQPSLNNDRWILASGKFAEADGVRFVSGPFLVVANSIQRSRAIGLGTGKQSDGDFSIRLTVLAEPKLRVLGAANQARLEQATDEHGNSLIAPAGAERAALADVSTGRWNVAIPLRIPDKPGTRIVRLKGSIEVLLQSKFQTVEFEDLPNARNVTRQAGGIQVVLTEMRARGERYELSISLLADKSAQVDRNQVRQSLASALQVLDAQGNAFSFSRVSTSGRDDRMDLVVSFRKPPNLENAANVGEPTRMVWNLPAAARQTAVPFEFNDLPIP